MTQERQARHSTVFLSNGYILDPRTMPGHMLNQAAFYPDGNTATWFEYAGREFFITICPDDEGFQASVRERLQSGNMAEWDDSGNVYDTAKEAWEAARKDIEITVDDDLDGNR